VNRIGRYEITEPLGQGGMGTVYKAYDPLLARVVAVKVISGQFSTQPDLRERFFREARAVARLDHPNIVTVYDLGEEDGVPYLAMQFLEGRDLEHRMRAPEGMSLARKVEVAIAVAAGLAHAHAAGIVHRDVKPANVFITSEGQVKLLDFGLARLVTSELTRSNVMVGTVNYMAPEQLRGDKTDHRVDIFSFGVVLYELFGGRKPFQAESFASIMYKILEETPEPLSELDPTLPPLLVAVVDRAIAKVREDRYQLMAELHRDLQASYELVRGFDTATGPQTDGSVRGSAPVKPRSNPALSVTAPDAPTIVSTLPDLTRPMLEPPTPSAVGRLPTPAPIPAEAGRNWRTPALAAAAIAVVLLAALFVRQDSSRTGAPVSQPAPAAPSAQAPAATPVERPAPIPAPPPEPEPAAADPQSPASPPESGADAAQNEGRLKAVDQEHLKRATTAMRTAKASAVSANAAAMVSELFSAAEKQERTARDAGDRGQLAAAAARMDAAATLYANAAASARLQQEARATRQREAEAAARAAEAAPKLPEASPRKAESPRPEVPPPAPAPTPPPAPAPPKPVETMPAKPAEAVNPAEDSRAAREAALAVLRRYTSALEHRDIAALKAIWPGLGGREQSAIETDFQNARSISVTFANPKVELSSGAAIVTGLRQYSLETKDRQALRSETLTTLSLKHVGTDWLIDSVRHQPK
jgi:serine/threonine-protein kinase